MEYGVILNSVLYEGDLNNSLKLLENRTTLLGPAGRQVTGIVGSVARNGDVGNACRSILS